MVNLFRKVVSGYRRLATGFRVTLFPDDFFIYDKKTHEHHKLSYSQEGEDRVLFRYFEGKTAGFFVDIGAHHPQRFSNTYLFYLHGWKGLNIDARPDSMLLFDKLRPKDINLEFSVSDSHRKMVYYEFSDPAMNTFSDDLRRERSASRQCELQGYKVLRQRELSSRTLRDILDEYLPAGQHIDFFSVDVEGLEYPVLRSNDWRKYRPEVVLVEDLHCSIHDLPRSDIVRLMQDNRYGLVAKVNTSLLFTTDVAPEP